MEFQKEILFSEQLSFTYNYKVLVGEFHSLDNEDGC